MTGSEKIDRPGIEVVGAERALDLDLRSQNDRVRFMLLGRIGAARDTESSPPEGSQYTLPALARHVGCSLSQLRSQIDQLDVTGDSTASFELIEKICARIGDEVTLRAARRTVKRRPPTRWNLGPGIGSWTELLQDPFDSPLMALMAAHFLETAAGPPDGAPRPNTSSFAGPAPTAPRPPAVVPDSAADWQARRRLAAALLRAATTGSGHALDAQVMLQRLCPLVLDSVIEFIQVSPRWVPCAHVLDRSLRARHTPEVHRAMLGAAADYVLGDRFLEQLAQRPPRSAAAMRLVRRVGLDAEPHPALAVQQRAAAVAAMPAAPRRARRYALWIVAELHAQHRQGELADEFAATASSAISRARLPGPGGQSGELADVGMVLEEFADGYLGWTQRFGPLRPEGPWADPFDVSLFSHDGRFEWPMPRGGAEALTRHVGVSVADRLYDAPWDKVPRRLVPAARRLVVEMLLHPGLVRTKAAADTLISAGPVVTLAATRTLASLLRDDLGARTLPVHLVEGALANLGYFRHEAALEVLTEYAMADLCASDLRAAAITSLGDVLHRVQDGESSRRPRFVQRGQSAIVTALDSHDPFVAAGAVHAAARTDATDCADRVFALQQRFGQETGVPQLAAWCLDHWDRRIARR